MNPTEWMDRGRCRETDPELFNPERGQSAQPAKRVCSVCEVREPCLKYALERNLSGIWGGLTDRERRALRPAA
jgi:WhiB family transcriptional regulator, redox-sensing transcriptional regulator